MDHFFFSRSVVLGRHKENKFHTIGFKWLCSLLWNRNLNLIKNIDFLYNKYTYYIYYFNNML